jgi:hypothetical protein
MPRPYWLTLWEYIDEHKDEASQRERLRSDATSWAGLGMWGRWASAPTRRERSMFKPLAESRIEKRYLRAGYIKLALKSLASAAFVAASRLPQLRSRIPGVVFVPHLTLSAVALATDH